MYLHLFVSLVFLASVVCPPVSQAEAELRARWKNYDLKVLKQKQQQVKDDIAQADAYLKSSKAELLSIVDEDSQDYKSILKRRTKAKERLVLLKQVHDLFPAAYNAFQRWQDAIMSGRAVEDDKAAAKAEATKLDAAYKQLAGIKWHQHGWGRAGVGAGSLVLGGGLVSLYQHWPSLKQWTQSKWNSLFSSENPSSSAPLSPIVTIPANSINNNKNWVNSFTLRPSQKGKSTSNYTVWIVGAVLLLGTVGGLVYMFGGCFDEQEQEGGDEDARRERRRRKRRKHSRKRNRDTKRTLANEEDESQV